MEWNGISLICSHCSDFMQGWMCIANCCSSSFNSHPAGGMP